MEYYLHTTNCFSCHKKIGLLKSRGDKAIILRNGYRPPERMVEHDKLCQDCLNQIRLSQVPEIIQEPQTKDILRKKSLKRIIYGAIIAGIGLGITIGTYNLTNAGGTYFVAYGAVLYGAYLIIRGLIGLIRHSF